jgi:hypothetical protein
MPAEPTVPTITSVMVDCRHLDAMVGFWTALLGVGVRDRVDGYVWLDAQRPGGYSLAFQQVDDPTPGKNRIHLDGSHPDLDALTTRIEALGGRLVDTQVLSDFVWNVYADVEGNVF